MEPGPTFLSSVVTALELGLVYSGNQVAAMVVFFFLILTLLVRDNN